MEHFLVINAGSSSVKLSVFEVEKNNLVRVINARAVRLFHQDAQITIYDDKNTVSKAVLAGARRAKVCQTSCDYRCCEC